MPRPKGTPNKITATVKEAVERSFHRVGKKNYLDWLAYENPSAYVTLVSKCIPSAVAIDVKHTLDLSAAMHEARLRLTEESADIIDVTPDQKETPLLGETLPNPLNLNDTVKRKT